MRLAPVDTYLKTTRLAWNCYLSTARRKPHTEPSWKIFLQSPFTSPTTYLYKGNPTNRTTTYRQSSKCSKPPPNVTMTMTIPLTLDHPPILKSTPANHATKPKSCFAYCEAQWSLYICIIWTLTLYFLFLFYWQT